MHPNDGPPIVTREALVLLRRTLIIQVNALSDVLGLPHVRPARDNGNDTVNGSTVKALDNARQGGYTDRQVE